MLSSSRLVDAGELAVSAAARLALLGPENQEKVLAERAQQLADRPPRRGRLRPVPTPLHRASPGAFGVLGKDAEEDRMLLWVETRALSFTIKALKRRGLRYVQRCPVASPR